VHKSTRGNWFDLLLTIVAIWEGADKSDRLDWQDGSVCQGERKRGIEDQETKCEIGVFWPLQFGAGSVMVL
jgi:hypothetical protein